MSRDIVAAIDAAVGCQQCGAPLGASPSDDFCGDACQSDWHAAQTVELVGYREPWRRPEDFPGVGSEAMVVGDRPGLFQRLGGAPLHVDWGVAVPRRDAGSLYAWVRHQAALYAEGGGAVPRSYAVAAARRDGRAAVMTWYEAFELWMPTPSTVHCDQRCGAPDEPSTPEEYRAAYEHWRYHGNMSGCSHGS